MIAKRPTDKPAVSEGTAPLPVIEWSQTEGDWPLRGAWRGLWLYEWHAHNRMLLAMAVLWLVLVWTLPLFANPGWLLGFGLFYALLAGPAFGGKDVIEGCEEFCLALPPDRSQRYLARLAIGAGGLVLFTGLDFIALGLDLSQAIARLYIETGFLRPVEVFQPRLLYGLVAALPWAVFGLGFALAANAPSHSLVFTSWFWSGLLSLLLLRLGLFLETHYSGGWTGYITCPLLVLASLVGLGIGYRCYRRREITRTSKPLVIPAHWWLWGLLFVLGLTLSLFLIQSIARELIEILRQ